MDIFTYFFSCMLSIFSILEISDCIALYLQKCVSSFYHPLTSFLTRFPFLFFKQLS